MGEQQLTKVNGLLPGGITYQARMRVAYPLTWGLAERLVTYHRKRNFSTDHLVPPGVVLTKNCLIGTVRIEG
jgi:hypothetical protein